MPSNKAGDPDKLQNHNNNWYSHIKNDKASPKIYNSINDNTIRKGGRKRAEKHAFLTKQNHLFIDMQQLNILPSP
jgi:hypothetical protein